MKKKSVIPENRSRKGRVIRGACRIRNIRSRKREKVEVHFLTFQCARALRRNFYWLSAHIFFAIKKRESRDDIRELIHNLHQEAALLMRTAAAHPLPESAEANDVLDLVLIHEDAEDLVDIFLMADRALFRLAEAVGVEMASEAFSRFRRAYRVLEVYVQGVASKNGALGNGKSGSVEAGDMSAFREHGPEAFHGKEPVQTGRRTGEGMP